MNSLEYEALNLQLAQARAETEQLRSTLIEIGTILKQSLELLKAHLESRNPHLPPVPSAAPGPSGSLN